MKRILLVLLGVMLLNTYMFAQLSSSVQTGKATREMKGGGLIAAHFNLPLGTRVKIINTETGKEIEVTIRGRIALSNNRIIDLSSSAWDALELTPDTDVRLIPPPSLANRPPPPAGYQEAEQAPVRDEQTEMEAIAEWDNDDDERELAEMGAEMGYEDEELAMFADEDEEPLAQPQEQPWQAQPEIQPRQVQPQEQPRQPAGPARLSQQSIKIVPGLPDPNSRKFYRLQIGAFSLIENADEHERRARALGFAVEREQHGALTRVLIVGIKASDVQRATQELEAAGFTEVWVREY